MGNILTDVQAKSRLMLITLNVWKFSGMATRDILFADGRERKNNEFCLQERC